MSSSQVKVLVGTFILPAINLVLPSALLGAECTLKKLTVTQAEEFISQLERISKLHQEGLLSDGDFGRAKLKLLKITE